MNLSSFSSLLVDDANDAKNLMSLLIGHYPMDKSGPAILALFESFPDDYKKETKLFAPVFLKLFHTYGMTEVIYPYYQQWKNNYASDIHKKIQDDNPQWTWGEEAKITFKNSLELTKALSTYQSSNYNHEAHQYQSALPFFKEFEEEITRLLKKDKNKLVDNFHKHKVWEFLIRDNYLFLKSFCNENAIDSMEVIKKIVGGSGYGISNYLAYHPMPIHQFEVMLDDIKEYGADEFFKESNFFKSIDKTDSTNLGVADNIIYALSYGQIEHGGLLANKFKSQLMQVLPWENDNNIYDNKKWAKYCNEKINGKRSYYGIQDNHIRHMDKEIVDKIGSLLEQSSFKTKLENELENTTNKISLPKL